MLTGRAVVTMLKLEDLCLKGKTQGTKKLLTFIQDDAHGLGTLDRCEYAIGLRRGTLSRPSDHYKTQALVREDMHDDFTKGRWALLPDSPVGLDKLVEELRINVRRPYHLVKDIYNVVSPRPDGMFVYRLIFIPTSTDPYDLHYYSRMSSEILDLNGEPVASGTHVLSPVHPFLVIPSLSFHMSRPLAEDPLMDEAIFPIVNWVSDIDKNVLHKRWIDDGWPDVAANRAIPQGILVDEKWEWQGSKVIIVSNQDSENVRVAAVKAAAERAQWKSLKLD
ncbi:hypothetical protein BKA70DRAFT_1296584 [Coprinopsis sp. MPI-PUGE-AT-0042]|nr:hypothetical protein BKA70DRAFT_1296584 [Coprinopsis sp. MPI-PUGE-AT-0042]